MSIWSRLEKQLSTGSPASIDLPGVSEVSLMCGNARRVASLCDALGLGEPAPDAPGDFIDFLGQAGELAHQVVPDGAFILPPE